MTESVAYRRLFLPEALRQLKPRRGLLVHGHLPPVRIRLQPGSATAAWLPWPWRWTPRPARHPRAPPVSAGRAPLAELQLPAGARGWLAAGLQPIDAITVEVAGPTRSCAQSSPATTRVRRLLPIPGIGLVTAATMTHSGYWPHQSHAHATLDKSMSSTAGDFRLLTPLVLMQALEEARDPVGDTGGHPTVRPRAVESWTASPSDRHGPSLRRRRSRVSTRPSMMPSGEGL